MSTITLAYHDSAEGEATRLETRLRELHYDVERLICSAGEAPLGDRLLRVDGPLLLLVNDPFLHGAQCQIGMLDAYRTLDQRPHFHPVLASSTRTGPGGVEVRLLTTLARVSDVIRYMNFWQNAYLTRRRDAANDPSLPAREELISFRRISQEIGEVLRLIRSRKPTDVPSLVKANESVVRELFGPADHSYEIPEFQAATGDSDSVLEPEGLATGDEAGPTIAVASRRNDDIASDFTETREPIIPSTGEETQAAHGAVISEADISEEVAPSSNGDMVAGTEAEGISDTQVSHKVLSTTVVAAGSPQANTPGVSEVDIADQVVQPIIDEEQSQTGAEATTEGVKPANETLEDANERREEASAQTAPLPAIVESRIAPSLDGNEPAATSNFTSTVSDKLNVGLTEGDGENDINTAAEDSTEPDDREIQDNHTLPDAVNPVVSDEAQQSGERESTISLDVDAAASQVEAPKTETLQTDHQKDSSSGTAAAKSSSTHSDKVTHPEAVDFSTADMPQAKKEEASGDRSDTGAESPPARGEDTRAATHQDLAPEVDSADEPSIEELAALASAAQTLTQTRNLQTVLMHRDNGETQQALAFARACLAADPEDYRMRYTLAVGLLQEAEEDDSYLDEAAVVMSELFDSPLAAQAHLCLGQIGMQVRDFGSARRHFRKAYKLNRRVDPELAYRIGALLQDEFEQPRKAARYLRIAARRSRKNLADAQYRLGLIERDAGKLRRATRHLKLALSYEDDHPFAAYELAVAYLTRERPLRALTYFNQATRANPELDTELNRQAFTPVDADGEPTRLPETITDKFFGFVREKDGRERDSPSVQAREDAQAAIPRTNDRTAGQSLSREAPQRSSADFERRLSASVKARTLVVMITGASSGIGAATARRFAAAGHRLILTGRRVDKLRSLSDELKNEHQTQVRLLSYDVADFQTSARFVEQLDPDWSSVDVLINNAGKALGLKPVHEATLEEIDGMLDTNVKGLLYSIRLIAPGMVKRGRGHIINVCSTAGHEVYAGGTIYCATKHAVDAITRGTRLDLFREGIRVSQVSPAAVEGTEFSDVRFDGDKDRAAQVYEGFRPLHADDVAEGIYQIATAPPHVNVQDVIMLSTQQGNSTSVDRSGRS